MLAYVPSCSAAKSNGAMPSSPIHPLLTSCRVNKPLHLRGTCNVSGRTVRPNDDRRYHQQQHDGAVNANCIAGNVTETESVVKQRGDKMDQHVREAKGIASDHPVSVPDDSVLFDLQDRHHRDKRPNDIKRVEPHTADFSSGRVRRHVPGSQHDKQYGHYVYVAGYTMQLAAFFKHLLGKIEQPCRHGNACKYNMNIHHVDPDREIQFALEIGFMAYKLLSSRIDDKIVQQGIQDYQDTDKDQ